MAIRHSTSTEGRPVTSEFGSSLTANSTIKYESSTTSRSSITTSHAQPISEVHPKMSKTTIFRSSETTTISEADSQSNFKQFLETNKVYLSIGAACFVAFIIIIVVIVVICCKYKKKKKKKEINKQKQFNSSKLNSKKRNTEKVVRKSYSDIEIKRNIKSSQPRKSRERNSDIIPKKMKSIPAVKEQRSKGGSKGGSKSGQKSAKKKNPSSVLRTLTPPKQLNSRVQFDETKNLVVNTDQQSKKKKMTSCRSSPNSSVAPLKSILKRRNSA